MILKLRLYYMQVLCAILIILSILYVSDRRMILLTASIPKKLINLYDQLVVDCQLRVRFFGDPRVRQDFLKSTYVCNFHVIFEKVNFDHFCHCIEIETLFFYKTQISILLCSHNIQIQSFYLMSMQFTYCLYYSAYACKDFIGKISTCMKLVSSQVIMSINLIFKLPSSLIKFPKAATLGNNYIVTSIM